MSLYELTKSELRACWREAEEAEGEELPFALSRLEDAIEDCIEFDPTSKKQLTKGFAELRKQTQVSITPAKADV